MQFGMDWRRQRPSLFTANEVWQIRHLFVLFIWVLQFSMLWDQHSSPGILEVLDVLFLFEKLGDVISLNTY